MELLFIICNIALKLEIKFIYSKKYKNMSSEDHAKTRSTLMVTTAVTGTATIVTGIKVIGTIIAATFGFTSMKVLLPLIAIVGGVYYLFRSFGRFKQMEYGSSNTSAYIATAISVLGALISYGFLF